MEKDKAPQGNEMVEFPCPVCHTKEYKIMYPNTLGDRRPSFDYNFTKNYNLTYRIVKCEKCTHNYASPRSANIWENYKVDREDPNIYIENNAMISDSVLMEGVIVGANAQIKNTIIDKQVVIPAYSQIGYDLELDRKRFAVTTSGIVIVAKRASVKED